jgi:hypothetical protein
MSNKSRLLDPIGTAFKLILLNFEPENTRITIKEHVLELEPPDITQFITRWWYGESRDDICCLTNTIVRFIEFYISEDNLENMENSFSEVFNHHEMGKKNIKLMAHHICSGLEKLENIYKFDNAALTLTYYRVLLKLAIGGKYTNDFLPLCMKDTQNYNFINSDKLREIWDDTQLDHICDLFNKLFETKTKNNYDICNFYLRGIKEILQNNDIKFREMISGI